MRQAIIISFLILLIFSSLAGPVWADKSSGQPEAPSLVPCGRTPQDIPCDFFALIELIQRVLNFLITLSVSVAAIAIMIGGWYMVTARGSESQLSQGKKIIGAAMVGLVLVLGAWLIVTAIIKFLGVDEGVIKLPSDPAP